MKILFYDKSYFENVNNIQLNICELRNPKKL